MRETDMIRIGKPYIEETKSDVNENGGIRLCAEVSMKNPNTGQHEKRVLYFEFEKEYKQYLCEERSDAFVAGLLTTAMETGQNIVFEAPMSERLYYQLTSSYIPVIAKNNQSKMKMIELLGECSNHAIESAGAVATGCAGGVDSFYTITRHNRNFELSNYQLTHLVFASCGTLDGKSERIKEYYMRQMPIMKELAAEAGCAAIGCYTNLHEFYKFPYYGFCNFYACTYASVVYAIQKLVAVYYINSGDPITEFNVDLSKVKGYDASIIDAFTVPCLNTENLSFFPAGIEMTRLEKEHFIADNPVAQKYLTVCGIETAGNRITNGFCNCGVCKKCLRTIVQFYVLNDLEKFSKVFDLNSFYKNKNKRIGYMLAYNKKCYVKDTLEIAKVNGVKFGISVYLWKWLWYKPIKTIAHLLSDNKIARKIFYRFNLDYKLHGSRDVAKYDVLVKGENKE